MILVVKNIEPKVKENELELLFNSYGEVIDTNLVYDTTTWQPTGFAFIRMENSKEAIDAMHHLNGIKLNGRTIVVQKAEVVQAR